MTPAQNTRRYQTVSLTQGLQDILFAEDYGYQFFRGDSPDETTRKLVQAGIIFEESPSGPLVDIFYSVWMNESIADTTELSFDFEGASEADISDVTGLQIVAGNATLRCLIDQISAHQIKASFRVLPGLVRDDKKRLVKDPFTLKPLSQE